MEAERYRMFVAAELPGAVVAALRAAQDALRAGRPPVAWAAPEAMHLTLQFLGEAPRELAPRCAGALRAALAGRRAPRLHLAAAGAFPSLRRPGVVWVGVGGEAAALGELAAAVGAALAPLGFAPDPRPFAPHLTIGRVRREAGERERRALGEAVRALPPPAAAWAAESVALVRSELRPGGARHTPIAEIRLESPE